MHDVLFFDDALPESENQLFLFQLRRALRDFSGEVVAERIVQRVEVLLQKRRFALLILDIMSAVPGNAGIEAVAGLEMLRKCRSGEYGPANQTSRIFIRTARAEPHIRRTAELNGCDAYYMAGSEDQQVLKAMRKIFLA